MSCQIRGFRYDSIFVLTTVYRNKSTGTLTQKPIPILVRNRTAMETPYTTHLTADDFHRVYEPAEDSFLLIDALESELVSLRVQCPALVVEIGPGSGVVITAVAMALGSSVQCVAVDINSYACDCTRRTASRNNASVDVVNGDLLGVLRPNSIDVLIFNPPYVVTPDAELQEANDTGSVVNECIVKSWAGGSCGRRITDRFLSQLDNWLTPRGRAYLLLIKENNPEEIIKNLGHIGFHAKQIAERKIRGEHLFVLKIERK